MLRPAVALAPVVALAFLLAGCSTSAPMAPRYDADGRPIFEKRYAKHMAVDYKRRFGDQAYRPATGADFSSGLSFDQQMIVAEVGMPEYVRRPFEARRGELVGEWVYWDQERVMQFVEGGLAYEGPLTDLERVLIEHGYPTWAGEVQFHGGGEVFHWVYRDPLQVRGKAFSFSNDKLIYEQQHN